MLFNLTQQANVEQRSQVEDPRARGFVYSHHASTSRWG